MCLFFRCFTANQAYAWQMEFNENWELQHNEKDKSELFLNINFKVLRISLKVF